MAGFDWRLVWKTTDGTPALKVIPDNYLADGYDGTPGEVWTGQIATNYAGGSGTKSDPYQIATGEQLAKLVQDTDTAGKYYKLTADILLNDVSKENWKSDLPREWFAFITDTLTFRGHLEGGGPCGQRTVPEPDACHADNLLLYRLAPGSWGGRSGAQCGYHGCGAVL